MRVIVLFLAISTTFASAASGVGYDLPAQFVAGRVYVVPQMADGRTLKLYTDTGGGLFLTEAAVRRLGLTTQPPLADPSSNQPAPAAQVVKLPPFKAGASIPAPLDNEGRLMVMPTDAAAKEGLVDDGMLGEAWFGGRVWTWDYPAQKLRLEGDRWKPDALAVRVPLGFPLENGERADNFARIAVRIDGKSIDMLLDTGATTTLTSQAMKSLADGAPAQRATSFIVDSQFKAWHEAHPDWRVVTQAEDRTHAAMIEVPEVEIAGAGVGPVWFTWRPDKNFHEYMSGMMDAKVEGAIGGNALAHFVMTIDYPSAAGFFRCAQDCKPTLRSAP